MGRAITQDRMEEALQYLLDTDDICAVLGADVERMEFKVKRTKAALFTISPGTSAPARSAIAETSPEVQAAQDEYFAAHQRFNAVKNKRSTESIVFEAWRSLNSNRRQAS